MKKEAAREKQIPQGSFLELLMIRYSSLAIPKMFGWPFFLGNLLQVTRHEVPIEELPQEIDRFCILHLTDFHVGEFISRRHLKRAINTAASLHADMIALTGDYLGLKSRYSEESIEIICTLAARHGVFAVMGNHDVRSGHVERLRDDLTARGITVLSNDSRTIELGGGRLAVVGVNDAYMGLDDYAKASAGTEEADVRLLLSHSPDVMFALNGLAPHLVLSGHSHGGQVRLPGIGLPASFSRYVKRHGSGMTRVGDCYVYNNRGIGTSFLPMRFRCRPEIARIHLVRKPV